jgi:hypothetical protein
MKETLRDMHNDPVDPLVIYHDDCVDGFTAAWAATRPAAWTWATLHPASYGDPEPPDSLVAGRDVLVVDFSYSRSVLERLARAAHRLWVFDHHATACDALGGLPYVTFDLARSGAGLVWDEWVGGPRPWLVDYVEDRDIWRKALPDTDAVAAWLAQVDRTMLMWDRLGSTHSPQTAVQEGRRVLASRDRYIDSVAPQAQVIPGRLALVNAPAWAVSDLLERLCERHHVPLAVAWHVEQDGRVRCSARGTGARELAERFGGGGHPRAAGWHTETLPTAAALAALPSSNGVAASASL